MSKRNDVILTDDAAEAKASLLKSLDQLRVEIVNDEVATFMCCGTRHDGDIYVCAHFTPSTPFRKIEAAIATMFERAILPAFNVKARVVPAEGAAS